MTAKQILEFITSAGIVPVVRASSADHAIRAVEALYNGGVRSAEITMTVPGAIKALEKTADTFGDKLVLGAGTVLDPETARSCMLAGAEFFVSPSLRISVIEMAKRYSKVIFPGALTPTEVLAAWEAGADAVKVFPCGNVGGANLDTVADFLKAGSCAVGVGGELVDAKLMAADRFNEIEERARQFLAVIQKTRAEMKK